MWAACAQGGPWLSAPARMLTLEGFALFLKNIHRNAASRSKIKLEVVKYRVPVAQCGTLRIQNHWCHAHPLVPYGTRMLRRLAVCASTSAKTAGMSCRISRRSDAINSSADVCCHTFASVSREWCGGLALLPGQVDENEEIFRALVEKCRHQSPQTSIDIAKPAAMSTSISAIVWRYVARICTPRRKSYGVRAFGNRCFYPFELSTHRKSQQEQREHDSHISVVGHPGFFVANFAHESCRGH